MSRSPSGPSALSPEPSLHRGVSSTVKLSVSKTELLGSNPSAPAITLRLSTGRTQHKDYRTRDACTKVEDSTMAKALQ